jgi:peptidoglycan/xylan/chitin deacetylase (PgdA/CDA1 family)
LRSAQTALPNSATFFANTTTLCRSATPTQRAQVAITFDDGYADNRAAAVILAAAGLPATFFITVGRIGERREVWWDRLEQVVMRCAPCWWVSRS